MRRTRKLALMMNVLAATGGNIRNSLKNRFYRSFAGRNLWYRDSAENGALAGDAGHGDRIIFHYPIDLRPGLAARGDLWLTGDYSLPGAIVCDSGTDPFAIPAPSKKWAHALHSFDWMRHLIASDNPQAGGLAFDTILNWAKADFIKQKTPMHPPVIARRLMTWSAYLPLLRELGSARDIAEIHTSIANQARWLSLTSRQTQDGLGRLHAAAGLTFAGLMLANRGEWIRSGVEQLMRETRRQMLPDGGHIGRAPDTVALLLADFTAIDRGLQSRNITPPADFTAMVKRMPKILAMLRHEDGGLACFNGGLQMSSEELAPLLKGHSASRMSYAQRSGYHRLKAQRTCVVVDVGDNISGVDSVNAHAAPLAFEMSHNQHRIIVNCGPNKVHGLDWQLAARGIAAHSTLAFDSAMEDPFLRHPRSAHRLGAQLADRDWQLKCRRVEDDGGVWLEARHGMFLASHGVYHNRRIFMDADGEDIRGEDNLLTDPNQTPRYGAPFHLRFHLHPSVNASLQAGGSAVLLVTGGGHGWQFRVSDEKNTGLAVEESVYMGQTGIPQRCQQITISGVFQQNNTLIRWGLRYAGRSGRRRSRS